MTWSKLVVALKESEIPEILLGFSTPVATVVVVVVVCYDRSAVPPPNPTGC